METNEKNNLLHSNKDILISWYANVKLTLETFKILIKFCLFDRGGKKKTFRKFRAKIVFLSASVAAPQLVRLCAAASSL